MSESDIKQNILLALEQMSLFQKLHLLKLIHAMLPTSSLKESHGILQFAGIFDNQDSRDFYTSLDDCEKIDEDEW